MGKHDTARRAATWIFTAAVVVLTPRIAATQECAQPQPGWLFCDDFESNADQNGQLGLWDDQGLGPQNLVLTNDPANVHGGARSLEITAHKGQDTGGGPTKWFLPGSDEIYVRFFTRFSASYNFLHHMVFIGASEASNQWAAFGMAGCRPSGSNFFVTQVEPFSGFGTYPPPGAWGFYTYSNDMQCDPGSNCANYADPQQICDDCASKGSPCSNGLECCWGTNDVASPEVVSPLATWVCLEARVQANTNAQSNGVQTLWIDGAQVGEWSGIRYRTDDALKINSLGLWHYVTDDVYASGQTQETVWFDDVVVSTSPIGCQRSGGSGGSSVGAGGNGSGGAGTGASGGGSRATSTGAGTSAGPSGPGATGTVSGVGGAANGATPDGASDGGCGCRVPVSSAGRVPAALVAAVLAGAVALVRRRRPRRAGTMRATVTSVAAAAPDNALPA